MNGDALWNLVDRAYKMMEQAGYKIAEHNPDHNNPIIAWMADARIALREQPIPDGHAVVAQDGAFVGIWRGRDIAEKIVNRSPMSKGERIEPMVFVNRKGNHGTQAG